MRRSTPIGCLLIVFAVVAAAEQAAKWQRLKDDELHDPDNPAVGTLQQPGEALSVLAPDSAGNQVDWVQAIRRGQIAPRSGIFDTAQNEQLDVDVIMKNTLSLPAVIFPHKAHTEWMSCETCHEELFVSEIDANPINMGKILNGEFCGRCHGAVSFPLTECNRCHSQTSPVRYAPLSGGKREEGQ